MPCPCSGPIEGWQAPMTPRCGAVPRGPGDHHVDGGKGPGGPATPGRYRLVSVLPSPWSSAAVTCANLGAFWSDELRTSRWPASSATPHSPTANPAPHAFRHRHLPAGRPCRGRLGRCPRAWRLSPSTPLPCAGTSTEHCWLSLAHTESDTSCTDQRMSDARRTHGCCGPRVGQDPRPCATMTRPV